MDMNICNINKLDVMNLWDVPKALAYDWRKRGFQKSLYPLIIQAYRVFRKILPWQMKRILYITK